MSGTVPVSLPESCGTFHGGVSAPRRITPYDSAAERVRATWTSGDFGRIATGFSPGAAEFVERLGAMAGARVLDVACGTGNLAIPAARLGATVTGIDIAPNLIDAARAASNAASLDIRFEVGLAEALPYPDASFDTVLSMFGVMFSARPEIALSELLRVTRPKGRIAIASWTPAGFVGSMLRAHTALEPPPAGTPSPLAWGDEPTMRRRLDAHRDRIGSVQYLPRTIDLAFPMSPGGVVELFRECYGPSVRAFAALDAERRARLAAELLRLWESRNATTQARTSVLAEYLEVRIEVA